MVFPLYDFDKSTYLNIKDVITQDTIFSAGKANNLKDNIGDAGRNYYTNGRVIRKIPGTIYLVDGEEYYNYVTSNGSTPQYPLEDGDNVIADLDTFNTSSSTSDLATILPSATPYDYAVTVKHYQDGLATGSDKVTTDVVDLLELIKTYQAQNNYFRFIDVEGNKLSISDTIDWLNDVKDILEADELVEPGTVYLKPNPLVSADDEDYKYINISIFNGAYKPYKPKEIIRLESDSLKVLFDGRQHYKDIDANDSDSVYGSTLWKHSYYDVTYTGDSTIPAVVDGDSNIIAPSKTVPGYTYTQIDSILGGDVVVTIKDGFDGDLIDEGTAAGLEELRQFKICKTLELVSEYFDNKIEYPMGIRMTVADILPVIDKYIADAETSKALLESAAQDILETPIGKLIGSEADITGYLEADVSDLNEMWLSYRIHNVNKMNNMEDEDERTSLDIFEGMVDRFPDWYKYVYPIVRKDSIYDHTNLTYTYTYKVVGYTPNWKKMEELPNRHFMYIMQTMGTRLEYGTPKPKKSWGAIIFSIIVIVIVTIWTLGVGTAGVIAAASQPLGMLVIAGAIASIASILTQSKTWAKIGQALAIVTAITGAYTSAIKNNITSTAIVQYALKLALMAQEFIYREKLKKLEGRLEQATTQIDEIEELITGVEKEKQVQEFIFSERFDDTYTWNYDYRYEWKYLS